MRTLNRNWGLWVLGVALGLFVATSGARANSTIQESGSVLIFPKIMATEGRDTLIEIVNTGNSMAHARCYYVNASRPGLWSITDFEIWLTKQQPTHWVASSGRRVDIFDDFGSDGAGFDPGRVPPVPTGFQGELKCVQVDQSGAPLRANKLIGRATIIRNEDGDPSSYNAIALKGNPDTQIGNNDNVLELNNTSANQGEYDTCPVTLTMSVLAEGMDDPVIDALGNCTPDCPISTTLTLVPCNQNLELIDPGVVTLTVRTYDEFETEISGSITVNCWYNQSLASHPAFQRQTLGVYARLIPVPGQGRVVGIAEELRTDGSDDTTWAAYNLVAEGTRVCSDTTPDALRVGRACTSDADCPGGACIDGGADRIVIPLFD